jgi:hypothetical protein
VSILSHEAFRFCLACLSNNRKLLRDGRPAGFGRSVGYVAGSVKYRAVFVMACWLAGLGYPAFLDQCPGGGKIQQEARFFAMFLHGKARLWNGGFDQLCGMFGYGCELELE